MQRPECSMEAASHTGIEGKREVAHDLRLAASGGATMAETIRTLAHHKDLQARATADLYARLRPMIETIDPR